MSRSRNCNCRCGCCTCPQTIEEFKVRINEFHVYSHVLSSGSEYNTECNTIAPIKGYHISDLCSQSGVSDGETDCDLNQCPNVHRMWYVINVDTCEVFESGVVSCDGSLLDIGDEFHYTHNSGYIPNSGIEDPNDPLPSGCDWHTLDPSGTLFRLSTCCVDTSSTSQFNVDDLCDQSYKQPVCQKCEQASIHLDLFGPLQTGDPAIPICHDFNYVGFAPKLYNDFYHEYDNICELDCGPLPDTLIGADEDTDNFPDRDFVRFWMINSTVDVRNLTVGGPQACCFPTAFGEIDVHGRLSSSSMQFLSDVTPGFDAFNQSGSFPDPERPATCNYCMRGSYHWDPVMVWNMEGPILASGHNNLLDRGDEDNPFSLLTRSGDGSSTLYDTHCMFDNDGNPDGDLENTIHGASLNRNISTWQFFNSDFHTLTRTWYPDFSGSIMGTPYYHLVLDEIERNDVMNPENNFALIVNSFEYFDGSLDANDDAIPIAQRKGAYFEIGFYIHSEYYREDIKVRSEYICPTVVEEGDPLGRIDCNFLTKRGLYFSNIVEHTQQLSNPPNSGIYLNRDDLEFLIQDIDLHVITNPSGLGPMNHMILSRFHDPDVALSRIDYDDADYCGIAIERKTRSVSQSITNIYPDGLYYELRACCCDKGTIIDVNTLEWEGGTGVADSDLKCDCSGYTSNVGVLGPRFNPLELCNVPHDQRTLIVSIIDESTPYATCDCSSTYTDDLDTFRDEHPNTDLAILQPVLGSGEIVECEGEEIDTDNYLRGECAFPIELEWYDNDLPRNNAQNTFDRLKLMFRSIALVNYSFIDDNYTSIKYPYIAIGIDDSGSVVSSEFSDGVQLFIDWIREFYPTVFILSFITTDEQWLLWASESGLPERLECDEFFGGFNCDNEDIVTTPV